MTKIFTTTSTFWRKSVWKVITNPWAWRSFDLLWDNEIIPILWSKYRLQFLWGWNSKENPHPEGLRNSKYASVSDSISQIAIAFVKGPLEKNSTRNESYFFTDKEAPFLRLCFPLLWAALLIELLAKGPQAFEEVSPPHLSPKPYSESLSLPNSSLSSTITWHKTHQGLQQNIYKTSLTGLLSTGVTGADLVRPKSIVRLEWLRFFTYNQS